MSADTPSPMAAPTAVAMVTAITSGDMDRAWDVLRRRPDDVSAEGVALLACWLASRFAREVERHTGQPGTADFVVQYYAAQVAAIEAGMTPPDPPREDQA